jgi:SagB-type dehydrogenase family enzyme
MKRFEKKLIGLTILAILCCKPFGVCAEDDIHLPAPDKEKGVSLMKALSLRKSQRSFSREKLSSETLSGLLWAAFGINRTESGLRTAPSAVNWQEIDIYVAMEEGLYRYDAPGHSLAKISDKDIREFTGVQDFTQVAPVNLIYVADYSKMSGDEKNKDFYSAADTGFISQNVYLYCAGKGLSTVVLGWVEREELADIMGLSTEQKIIFTQPVGYTET